MPSACQHFPRVCLIDDRGLSATLSHYCPTAARLLFDTSAPLAIVERPRLLERELAWEGLDARGEWPPLLRPGRLMDLASYEAWERFAIATFDRADVGPEEAILRLAGAAEGIRTWNPLENGKSLSDRVRNVAEATARTPGLAPADWSRVLRQGGEYAAMRASHDLARQSVEPGLETPPAPDDLEVADSVWVREAWPQFAAPLRRYLASKAFASWIAYQGYGLRTIVQSVRLALDVVRVEAVRAGGAARRPLDRDLLTEAIRAADLQLLHVVSRTELARRLSTLVEA